MVAGIHPTMPYEHYLDVVRVRRSARARLHVKALLRVEIEHMINGTRADAKTIGVRRRSCASASAAARGGGAEVLANRRRVVVKVREKYRDRGVSVGGSSPRCSTPKTRRAHPGRVRRRAGST